MLLWLGGAATIAYVCRNSLGVAEKEIRNNLGLDAFQMGLVMEGRFRFRARSCKSPPSTSLIATARAKVCRYGAIR